MAELFVRLFGGLALTWGETPLPPIPGATARSLLAYLLTYRDRPHTRDLLAGTFWPDQPEATARRRLSQALWQIRSTLDDVLPTDLLRTEGDTVRINPDLPLWIDVEEFTRHKAQGTKGGAEALEHCALCLEHYTGEFLAGYYDDWLLVERERLRERFLTALAHLVAGYKRQGDYERALVHARRLASEDPWREEAHREVMRLCHLLGRDAEALEQFEICRQVLAEELDAEPSAETQALAAEIACRTEPPAAPLLPIAARPVAAPHLVRPESLPLVGRQRELAELLRRVEAAAGGEGGLTLIYGEAGVGKTRLLQEVARNAQWRGVPALWGRCYELAAPPAYQPLVEVLRAGLARLRASTLAPLWRAELARLLPELAGDSTPPPALPPAEEQRRLLEALTRGLLALAGSAPHLLLLEDAHWMDPASLETLRYLLPRLAGAPLHVFVTVRSEELAGQQAAIAAALENTRLPRCLDLDRLDLAGTEELVQRALALAQPAPRFSARLYDQTEGNPFFLLETLETLVDEGQLFQNEAGRWSTRWDESTADYAELPVPASVVQSIERRLDRLPARQQELLSLAAVIGRDVPFDLWLQASDRGEESILKAGDDLCQRSLLLPAGQEVSGADYRFAHDQIRRVAYERLAVPRRRVHHRRVAQALIHLAPDGLEALAYHWTRAEAWDQAADYHQQAGDRARVVYANAEAAEHYSQALAALERLPGPPDLARIYELRLGREAVQALQGARTAQAEDLAALEDLAEQLDSDQRRIEVALCQVCYLHTIGDYSAANEVAQQVIELAQRVQDVGGEAAGHFQQGAGHWLQGDCQAARSELEQALTLAQAAQTLAGSVDASAESLRQMEADSLRLLGNVCGYLNDYTEAISFYERSLKICREIGDRQGEGKTLGNIGSIVYDQGDYAKSRACLEQALSIVCEIGDRQTEANTLTNLGYTAVEQGDYARGRAYLDQARQIYREIGDRHGVGWLLNYIGQFAVCFGNYAEAAITCERALRLCQEVGDRLGEAWGLANLSLYAHSQGNHEDAREYGQQAIQITEEIGERFHQAYALKNLGHALGALGRLADAADAYQRALDLRRELGQSNLAMEPLAGLAYTALAQGDTAEAQGHVLEILSYLEDGTLKGTNQPFRIYLTCYRVLHARGDPRAAEILETAHSLLQEWAAGIDDEEMRHSFLKNVVAHRELLDAYREWQTLQQGHQRTVRLPRTGAPTGRPLDDDEYVTVTWTLEAPKDEAIEGKVARRQARLRRLLREAAEQGAAPTVEDLAAALEVSYSTLKRDLAALRQTGYEVKTWGSR